MHSTTLSVTTPISHPSPQELLQRVKEYRDELLERSPESDPKYANETYNQLVVILRRSNYKLTEDATRSAVNALLLINKVLTVNNYLNCAKRFTRWLHQKGYVAENYLAKLKKHRANPLTISAFSLQQLADLIDAAFQTSPQTAATCKCTGRDRAAYYEFAASTGLGPRTLELLTIDQFNLTDQYPHVIVRADQRKKPKRGKPAPLRRRVPRDTAEQLVRYFGSRDRGDKAFRMPARNCLSRRLHDDARRAKLVPPPNTKFRFHSLILAYRDRVQNAELPPLPETSRSANAAPPFFVEVTAKPDVASAES